MCFGDRGSRSHFTLSFRCVCFVFSHVLSGMASVYLTIDMLVMRKLAEIFQGFWSAKNVNIGFGNDWLVSSYLNRSDESMNRIRSNYRSQLRIAITGSPYDQQAYTVARYFLNIEQSLSTGPEHNYCVPVLSSPTLLRLLPTSRPPLLSQRNPRTHLHDPARSCQG